MQDAQNALDRMSKAAARAKSELAWLAAIHVALKSRQQEIPEAAAELLANPECHLKVRNYPPAEAREVRAKGVEAFRVFCDCVQAETTEAVGGYLNKSAMVYADAVLQAVLDGVYEPVAEHLNAKVNPRLPAELKCNSIGGKLDEMAKNLSKPKMPHTGHARLVAELRHKITHNGGCVDAKFLACCGVQPQKAKVFTGENRKGRWACADGPYWGPQYPWKNEDDFLDKNWYQQVRAGKDRPQVDLAIETVVIPCLRRCVRFIEELEEALAVSVT